MKNHVSVGFYRNCLRIRFPSKMLVEFAAEPVGEGEAGEKSECSYTMLFGSLPFYSKNNRGDHLPPNSQSRLTSVPLEKSHQKTGSLGYQYQ